MNFAITYFILIATNNRSFTFMKQEVFSEKEVTSFTANKMHNYISYSGV